MTRLARRNRTRWIKARKKQGHKWFRSSLWKMFWFRPLSIQIKTKGFPELDEDEDQ